VSYAGTLDFGLIGAGDTLPHLQRLAIYLGEAVDELSRLLLGGSRSGRGDRSNRGERSLSRRRATPAARSPAPRA